MLMEKALRLSPRLICKKVVLSSKTLWHKRLGSGQPRPDLF